MKSEMTASERSVKRKLSMAKGVFLRRERKCITMKYSAESWRRKKIRVAYYLMDKVAAGVAS
jgi:hypothetical protein